MGQVPGSGSSQVDTEQLRTKMELSKSIYQLPVPLLGLPHLRPTAGHVGWREVARNRMASGIVTAVLRFVSNFPSNNLFPILKLHFHHFHAIHNKAQIETFRLYL